MDGIEELNREVGPSGRADRGHLAYGLLRARYVEGRSIAEICARSAISKSEYYRRHRRALAGLTNLIQTRLHPPATSPRTPEPRRVAAITTRSVGRPTAAAHPSQRIPFVGRAAELDRLREAFAAVANGGGGRIVWITGDAGVGKTRLVEEVGSEIDRQGGRFVGGRYLRDVGAAYGPWVDALQSALARLGPREAARLAHPYRNRLAQLLPILAGAREGGGDPAAGWLSPEDQRQQLHDGLTHLLRGLGEQRPLLVLLDDLHWAPSLDVLRHLAGRLHGLRVLIAGTLRKAEFERRAERVRARSEIDRMDTVLSIRLSPLDQAETERLVADVFGAGPARQLGAALYRRTRGNPFFIEETLRTLQETGALRQEDGGWRVTEMLTLPLPDSVRATVLEHVGHLGDETGRVLSQAAVLGETFRAADLRSISRLDDEALGEALEAALAAELIRECPDAADERYVFCDQHVRDALYDSLSAPRRRRWHQRAARLREADPAPRERRA